jgi:hypothetical protein
MAISGHNGNNETFIGVSNSIGLTFYDLNSNEIPIVKSSIDIVIQRDSNLPEIYFQYVNATQIQLTHESFYLPNAFNLTSKNASIHIELEPTDKNFGYFLVLNLGSVPIINSTYSNYEAFQVNCPGILILLLAWA